MTEGKAVEGYRSQDAAAWFRGLDIPVRFRTHDVQGLSETDFECASLVDALLA